MAQDGHGEGWHPARLIPAMGIRGQEEQEKRATTSLLAVMAAVPEFGHGVLGPLGAPKGQISTYAEVQLKDSAGKTHIPDGAVVVERGKKLWRCLVEVKTGTAELKAEQVGRYLDMAREHRFDAVWTVSNQITSAATEAPEPDPVLRRGRFDLRPHGGDHYRSHVTSWGAATNTPVAARAQYRSRPAAGSDVRPSLRRRPADVARSHGAGGVQAAGLTQYGLHRLGPGRHAGPLPRRPLGGGSQSRNL
jgi:hypothetical protein